MSTRHLRGPLRVIMSTRRRRRPPPPPLPPPPPPPPSLPLLRRGDVLQRHDDVNKVP